MAGLKQVILVRTDLKLTKGKMSAQVAHASIETVLKSKKEVVDAWRRDGMKKVVLKVETESDLKEYLKRANNAGLVTGLIADGGHTHLEPGTVTCLGIGPAPEEKIDAVTKDLKLFG